MLNLLASAKAGVEANPAIKVEDDEDLFALVIVRVLIEDSLLVGISLGVGMVLVQAVRIFNHDRRDRMVQVGLLGALLTVAVQGRTDKVTVS